MLQATGAVLPNQDWFALSRDLNLIKKPFVSFSRVLLGALTDAAENRRVAETVLLANWLLQTGPLETMDPDDLATIITALRAIGQSDIAKELAKEILEAHLLHQFFKGAADGTAS